MVAGLGSQRADPVKVLILTRYGRLGASSRLRFLQFLPWLEQAGVQCHVHPLINDDMLAAKYRTGAYRLGQLLHAYGSRVLQLLRRRQFDLLWIEKEALPWIPAWLERALLWRTPYVLDYDDAIFHNYDLNSNPLVRALWSHRIDRLMAGARLVLGGNDYLAQRARGAGARRIEVLPTVVDLMRYAKASRPPMPQGVLRIVWIGSPGTLRYLSSLAGPLAELSKSSDFVLRVVGGKIELPGVRLECVDWTETSEIESIAACDIGIMPLADSPWEHGKCGYKLIQYMACGLPVVASPVGVNRILVNDGVNGFLAGNDAEWVKLLRLLLENPEKRALMGYAGRQSVESTYCLQKVAPRLYEFLSQSTNEQALDAEQ